LIEAMIDEEIQTLLPVVHFPRELFIVADAIGGSVSISNCDDKPCQAEFSVRGS
jgi:hypothetical protein